MRERDLAGPRPTCRRRRVPAAELVWCGERNGGVTRRLRGRSSSPATDAMLATCSMSAYGSGGSNPASRSASMLLPLPGGPIIRRLWPPAAATVSARLPNACPRTSPKSSATSNRNGSARAVTRGSGCAPSRCRTTSVSVTRHRLRRRSRAPLRPRSPPAARARGRPSRRDHGRQRARDRAQIAVQRELAEELERAGPPSGLAVGQITPSAIGRSKRPPCFGMSAGPEVGRDATDRNGVAGARERGAHAILLSRTAPAGRPVTANPGSPPAR